jgi:hypothetical protein
VNSTRGILRRSVSADGPRRFVAGDEPPTHVTQREFYSALTPAFSVTIFSSASPNRSTVNVLYLAISVLMVVNYSVASCAAAVAFFAR